MSYCGMVYRLSFKRLAVIRGSRAQQLLDRLAPKLRMADEDFDDEEDEDDEPLPRPSDALRQIVMGEPLMSEYPAPYGFAFIALYQHIGRMLDNAAVAPASHQLFEAVDAALTAEGIPAPVRLQSLFFRGLPILEVDWPEPFPTYGYLTPDEVASARGRIKGMRWSRYDAALHPALHQLDYWLDEAGAEDQGLVAYYS